LYKYETLRPILEAMAQRMKKSLFINVSWSFKTGSKPLKTLPVVKITVS